MSALWTLSGLTARQGRKTVLEAASLTVAAGEVLCGKTHFGDLVTQSALGKLVFVFP